MLHKGLSCEFLYMFCKRWSLTSEGSLFINFSFCLGPLACARVLLPLGKYRYIIFLNSRGYKSIGQHVSKLACLPGKKRVSYIVIRMSLKCKCDLKQLYLFQNQWQLIKCLYYIFSLPKIKTHFF